MSSTETVADVATAATEAVAAAAETGSPILLGVAVGAGVATVALGMGYAIGRFFRKSTPVKTTVDSEEEQPA